MIITTRNTLSPPHHPLSNTKHTLRPFFNTEIPSVIRIREEFKSKTYPRDNGGWCCSTRIWDAIGYRVTLGGVWRAVVVVLRMEVVVLLDTRLGRVQVSSDAGRGVASCGGGCGLWCREWWWSCLGRVQGWRDVGRGVVVVVVVVVLLGHRERQSRDSKTDSVWPDISGQIKRSIDPAKDMRCPYESTVSKVCA